MRIGSHGMHHRPWKSLSERQSHEELVVAREVLTEIVGAPVTRAALPLGRYDRPALTRLRRLGYTQVATSDRRLSSEDDWLSHRFSVRREEPVADLQAAVARAGGLAGGAVLAAKGIVKRLL
jgi:peptidoglycan/xylan/chitin deacetylase (PgdA/CDA1 family)